MRYFLVIISVILVGCGPQVGADRNEEASHNVNHVNEKLNADGSEPENKGGTSNAHRIGDVIYESTVVRNVIRDSSRYITVVYTVLEDGVMGDYLKHLALNEVDFNRLINYCAFEAQKDFTISDEKGHSYACLNSVFERTYGLKQGVTFNLAFEVPVQGSELVLKYNDRLVGNGPVRIAVL